MSVAFASARPRGKGEVTQQTIQKVKEHAFIQTILDIYSVHAPAAGGWFLGRSGKLVNLRGLQRWTAGEREVGEGGGGGGGGTKQRCSDRCKESERRTQGIKSGWHVIPAARQGERLPSVHWETAIKFANMRLIYDGMSASGPQRIQSKRNELK